MNKFYGRHAVLELLKSERPVRTIWVAVGSNEHALREILLQAGQKKIQVRRVPKHALDAMVRGNHQGIVAEAPGIRAVDFKTFISAHSVESLPFLCLLDEIQDPHNLGAIVRSAACFGCSGIVIPKWRSTGVTDAVLKSSCGAAAHVPIMEISNLGVAIERLKEKGYTIYGAVPGGTSLKNFQFDFPAALLMGNEHRGIKPMLQEACDHLISIPQKKIIASLNVSNAAAILFYEIGRSLESP